MTRPITFQEHVPLASFSNFKIGGEARYFFEATQPEEIAEAMRNAYERGLKVFILGGGTNLLISDQGFPGLVLKPSLTETKIDGTTMIAGSGVRMADLLNMASEAGLSGLEWAGGLPGTVGGAVRGNAGCFGGETKDVVVRIISLDPHTLATRSRKNTECDFEYRTSAWKSTAKDEIILEATFEFKIGDRNLIQKAIQEKIDYRAARHPLEYPNIGSIFKNIPVKLIPEKLREQFLSVIKTDPFPVVPAAYLISEAKLKNIAVGNATVSPKHPNFIVNMGNARAKDVSELIEKIKKAVFEKFSIALEEEVERVG